MPTCEITWRNQAKTFNANRGWKKTNGYRIQLCITKDEDDGFSAIAMNLPGAGSCGDSEEEAVENAREAVRGVLECYAAAGEEIPWKNTAGDEIPFGAERKWIIVNA